MCESMMSFLLSLTENMFLILTTTVISAYQGLLLVVVENLVAD
jgi:hypothetical protein